ncbi:MAG TPA: hypothetical protein VE890_08205, partial [Thermoguttaceae bacterium]|nr:hypothetical protein [Thermoguttaceae bacterium]
LPHHFVTCMWTSGRRRALARRAAQFDGVLVLGCDATTETVRNAIGSAGCRVIQAMEIEGIMNVLPKVSFPLNISLQVQGITPVVVRPPEETGREEASGEQGCEAETGLRQEAWRRGTIDMM